MNLPRGPLSVSGRALEQVGAARLDRTRTGCIEREDQACPEALADGHLFGPIWGQMECQRAAGAAGAPPAVAESRIETRAAGDSEGIFVDECQRRRAPRLSDSQDAGRALRAHERVRGSEPHAGRV